MILVGIVVVGVVCDEYWFISWKCLIFGNVVENVFGDVGVFGSSSWNISLDKCSWLVSGVNIVGVVLCWN